MDELTGARERRASSVFSDGSRYSEPYSPRFRPNPNRASISSLSSYDEARIQKTPQFAKSQKWFGLRAIRRPKFERVHNHCRFLVKFLVIQLIIIFLQSILVLMMFPYYAYPRRMNYTWNRMLTDDPEIEHDRINSSYVQLRSIVHDYLRYGELYTDYFQYITNGDHVVQPEDAMPVVFRFIASDDGDGHDEEFALKHAWEAPFSWSYAKWVKLLQNTAKVEAEFHVESWQFEPVRMCWRWHVSYTLDYAFFDNEESTEISRQVCPRFRDNATGKFTIIAALSITLSIFALIGLLRFAYKMFVLEQDVSYWGRCIIPLGHGLSMAFGFANVFYIYQMKDMTNSRIRFLHGLSTGVSYLLLLFAFEARQNEYSGFLHTMASVGPDVWRLLISSLPIFFGFVFAGVVWFGRPDNTYANPDVTAKNLFAVMMGDNILGSFQTTFDTLGQIYIFSFTIFWICITLNALLAIVEHKFFQNVPPIGDSDDEDQDVTEPKWGVDLNEQTYSLEHDATDHFEPELDYIAEKYSQELLTNLDQQRRKPAHDALVDLRDRLQLRFEAIHNLLRKNLRREFGRWAERYGAEEPSGPQPSTFSVSPGARFDNFSINS